MTFRFDYFILTVAVCAALFFSGCNISADNLDDEIAVGNQIVYDSYDDPDMSLAQIDSLENNKILSPVAADMFRAIVCCNFEQIRLATYYVERTLGSVDKNQQYNIFWKAKLLLADCKYQDCEYGKSIQLCKELIEATKDRRDTIALIIRSKACSQIAECEEYLHLNDSVQKHYLESIDILSSSFREPKQQEEIEPLIYNLLSLSSFYLNNSQPQKAVPLLPVLDSALKRMSECDDVPEYVNQLRYNNALILRAMVLSSTGRLKEADSLYRIHCQCERLTSGDIAAEAYYFMTIKQYDEAIRLLKVADSMHIANGEPLGEDYISAILSYYYEALCIKGDLKTALEVGGRIRTLTDSLRAKERIADVEQVAEIKRQENIIAEKQISVVRHRTLLILFLTVCLLIGYMLWRSRRYNRELFEKNCRLLAEIGQHEEEQRKNIEHLKEEPAEKLSTQQQIFRRLCELLDGTDRIYTDPELDRSVLAAMIGTNEHYISDAVSTCTNGKSVLAFLNGYRLKYAVHLLSTTNDSVALIAEMSGFSRRSFYRVFNDTYSMSPSEYRKMIKK